MADQKPGVDNSGNPAAVATIKAYIALVRAKMRDYPELNRLVAGQETSDRQIALALLAALDDYNSTPPLLPDVSLTAFPSKELLVTGAIIEVLESVGLLQTRNHMNYSDGQGIQVGVNDKAPQLLQWANNFRSRYEQKKGRLKVAINLKEALGAPTGVSSEYLAIHGFLDELD